MDKVAQLVEHLHAEQEVTGSYPVLVTKTAHKTLTGYNGGLAKRKNSLDSPLSFNRP